MEKLRDDLNAVFTRQQSGLGSTAGVTDRLLSQALAPSQVQRRFAPQLAAALATLLVGAAVAYVVVVTHGHLKSQNPVSYPPPLVRPSVSAKAIPAPTPLARPFVVPSSTPAILYFDPVDPQQVDGITWDGAQRGQVGTNAGPAIGIIPNPAGSLYSTFRDIRNRSGQVVAQTNSGGKGFGNWADDGAHYCQIYGAPNIPINGEPTTLQLVTVGEGTRNVARVGTVYEQTSIHADACSTAHDQAIVVQSGGQGIGTKQVWAVRLTTGQIVWTRSYADGNLIDVHASRDGQFVAEVTPNGASSTTVIYDAAGRVAGRVEGVVQGFSWDGRFAVVAQYGARPSLIEWSSGRVVWTAPAGTMYTGSIPEPGGSRIAIEVQTPEHPQTTGFPTVDVYAVSPDGTAVKILSNVSL
jgi:hypothetical protein